MTALATSTTGAPVGTTTKKHIAWCEVAIGARLKKSFAAPPLAIGAIQKIVMIE
jgi:hypothetical protein